ncbi:hypothetical protein B0H17DRAFT_1140789 [Mycena rosella]|uniref:Uncharacterized protein n=1 Tax=Mycena rosella TaxID=1033263 RepID=A0AAD7D185_MYCRO|nr:hypothetical protein B0H17DRAFT_1140789 [Mycena rosella]
MYHRRLQFRSSFATDFSGEQGRDGMSFSPFQTIHCHMCFNASPWLLSCMNFFNQQAATSQMFTQTLASHLGKGASEDHYIVAEVYVNKTYRFQAALETKPRMSTDVEDPLSVGGAEPRYESMGQVHQSNPIRLARHPVLGIGSVQELLQPELVGFAPKAWLWLPLGSAWVFFYGIAPDIWMNIQPGTACATLLLHGPLHVLIPSRRSRRCVPRRARQIRGFAQNQVERSRTKTHGLAAEDTLALAWLESSALNGLELDDGIHPLTEPRPTILQAVPLKKDGELASILLPVPDHSTRVSIVCPGHYYIVVQVYVKTPHRFRQRSKANTGTNLMGTDKLSVAADSLDTNPWNRSVHATPSVSLATRSWGIGKCSGTPVSWWNNTEQRHALGSQSPGPSWQSFTNLSVVAGELVAFESKAWLWRNLGSLVWVFFYDTAPDIWTNITTDGTRCQGRPLLYGPQHVLIPDSIPLMDAPGSVRGGGAIQSSFCESYIGSKVLKSVMAIRCSFYAPRLPIEENCPIVRLLAAETNLESPDPAVAFDGAE